MNRTWSVLPLVLTLGCQGDPNDPPNTTGGAPPDDYVATVRDIKRSHTADLDDQIRRVQHRFGLVPETLPAASSAGAKALVSLSQAALVTNPTAFQELHTNAAKPAGVQFRRTFRVKKPGNIVRVTADAFGTSDPVLFLIQFDDPSFQQSGALSSSEQAKFRIVARDDDGNGGLSSKITWQAGADLSHFMIVAAPYSDASRGRTIIHYAQYPVDGDCGVDNQFCESYVTTDPQLDLLGGGIVRGYGGNRFEVLSANLVDPWLFVFNSSEGVGVANDDNNGLNSVVQSPGFSLPTSYQSPYDMVLVSGYSGNGTVSYRQGIASEPEVARLEFTPACTQWKPPVGGSLFDPDIELRRSGLANGKVVPGFRTSPATFTFTKLNRNAVRYRVFVNGNSCPQLELPQDSTDTLTFKLNQELGVTYTVSVSAVFADGVVGIPTSALTYTARTTPNPPKNVFVDNIHPYGVKVHWTPGDVTQEEEIEETRIYLNDVQAARVYGRGASFTSGLTVNTMPSTTYRVTLKSFLRVVTNGGPQLVPSEPSNEVTFTTPVATLPPPVMPPPATCTPTSVTEGALLFKTMTNSNYWYAGQYPNASVAHRGSFTVKRLSMTPASGTTIRLLKFGKTNCSDSNDVIEFIPILAGVPAKTYIEGAELDALFAPGRNRVATQDNPLKLVACTPTVTDQLRATITADHCQ